MSWTTSRTSGSAQAPAYAAIRARISRPSSQRPIGSASGRSQPGRAVHVYFQTARVPATPSRVSGVNRHPPPNDAKNHGPFSIVIPTEVGGRYDT